MKDTLQVGRFDQKIIDEELPAHVDGNDLGGIVEIRHRHGLSGLRVEMIRRPDPGQDDAIVEHFARILIPRLRRRGAVFLDLRPCVHHEKDELLETKPIPCRDLLFVEADAVDLTGEKLRLGHVHLRETRRHERVFLARGRRALCRGERIEQAGLCHRHVGPLDTRAEKGFPHYCFGRFFQRVVAIGEELHTGFHDGGRQRWRCGPFDPRLSLLGLEPTDGFQFSKHDAIGTAAVVALRDVEPDHALVLVEGRILEGMR